MTTIRKGIMFAVIQCALVLSISGKLLYDRATCPGVWVKTAPWDSSLPIRGRYLSLQLQPQPGDAWAQRIVGERVLSFVPEHMLPFERAGGPELWVEVTIPRHGPSRPSCLA